jgi:hypothetical protein
VGMCWLSGDVVVQWGCGGSVGMWWLSGNVVAQWECGGSVRMWWLSGDVVAQFGDVAAQLRGCGGSVSGDVVAQLGGCGGSVWECGGSVMGMWWLSSGFDPGFLHSLLRGGRNNDCV